MPRETLEEACHCKKTQAGVQCPGVARLSEEAFHEGYDPGELISFLCNDCNERWDFCKTCMIRFNPNNRNKHPSSNGTVRLWSRELMLRRILVKRDV